MIHFDVVYKLGIGSKIDDKELRYSLRSLSHFKDLGKVYIVGHKPAWIKNIIHVQATDVFLSNKDANLISKLVLACNESDISQYFLNFSDDQILLRDCSIEDFKTPYYDNSLIQFVQDQKLNKWKTRLRNTIRTLQERKLPANCYETHIPTLINKNDYVKTVLQYNYPEGQGMCGNTLYFNTSGIMSKPLPPNYALKLETVCPDVSVLENMCEGKLHFNYSESAINDNLFAFLEKKFPNKSIYE